MTRALRMEWTKLRSAPGTVWSAIGLVGGMLLLTVLVCATSTTTGCEGMECGECVSGECNDVVRDSLSGVIAAQIAVVALAVMAAEYGAGTIGATFLAEPRRRLVLAAKALTVGGLVLAAALVAAVASYAVGRTLLAGNGFDASNGYPEAGVGVLVRPVAGTALYLTALALLCLGVAVIVRHSAAAITAVLALLFVPLIAASLLPDGAADWVLRTAPMTAGLAVQQTIDRTDRVPIDEWAGLGVLGLWAAAALLIAVWLIARRDA
jgi:ABC-2 type transport system permease protein